MLIHRTFDEVFRTRSNVAVMRALIDTNTGFTGNEVARVSGIHPRSAFKALTLLENLCIVKRQIGGRDHIFTLNRKNFFVQEVILPLFRKEQLFRDEVFKSLAKILKGKVVSATVFGSTARKEEKPGSDLDICCIVEKRTDVEKVRSLLNNSSQNLYEKYGIKISPVLFTVSEFNKKKNTQLVRDIIREGKEITGSLKKVIANG